LKQRHFHLHSAGMCSCEMLVCSWQANAHLAHLFLSKKARLVHTVFASIGQLDLCETSDQTEAIDQSGSSDDNIPWLFWMEEGQGTVQKSNKKGPERMCPLLWPVMFWPLRAWVGGITGGLVAGEGFEPTTKGL
jgi:hypothetical protein